MSAFLAFMALGVKFLQLPEFWCQNGSHKAKNYNNSIYVAVALAMAFEKNFGLYFSRGPWYLKSPVECKHCVCE